MTSFNIFFLLVGFIFVQVKTQDSLDASLGLPMRPSRLGRCPPIEHGEVGICAFMCGPSLLESRRSLPSADLSAGSFPSGRSCPPGQLCCPTACGGTSCRLPYTNTRYDRCPKSKPRVFCFVDPCRFATCRRYPNARKESDYCGTCRCRFYRGRREVTHLCKN